jgi:GTP pyrophosphokinase
VDVAYAVHTDIGHRTIGARVNGRLVPLHIRLRNGDVVEILTSNLPNAGPSEDWLDFVKTSRARVRIRRRLARQRRDAAHPPAAERPAVASPAAVSAGLPQSLASPPGPLVSAEPGSAEPGSAAAVPRRRLPVAASAGPGAGPPGEGSRRPPRRGAPAPVGVAAVDGRSDLPVRLAGCCLPLPGDAVVGLTTHGSALSLHRQECANVSGRRSDRERVAVASWSTPERQAFPAEIIVEAFDRYGLLADITGVLSEASAAVRAASTFTSDDRVAHARFTIEVTGPGQLARVLAAVRGVGGVYDCYRACLTTTGPA